MKYSEKTEKIFETVCLIEDDRDEERKRDIMEVKS